MKIRNKNIKLCIFHTKLRKKTRGEEDINEFLFLF